MGLFAGLQGRVLGSYPAFNDIRAERIGSFAIIDATMGYRLPWYPNVMVSITATNLFDNERRELPGLAEIGRLVLGTLRAEF